MKKTILLFIPLFILLSCGHHSDIKETFYIVYYGDRDETFPDLVLKNDSNAHVDSIMSVGVPIEYTLPKNEFSVLSKKLNEHPTFVDTNTSRRGLLVMHYVEKKKTESYLFSSPDVKQLIQILESTISGENKKNSVEWMKGVCNMKEME